MRYVTNAFSLNMLREEVIQDCQITVFEPASWHEYYGTYADWRGAIGHADTRVMVEELFRSEGQEYPPQESERPSVVLDRGDEVLVAQYRGPRLPEGTTQLPQGAQIRFYVVRIA